jgi:UDP-N-acetylmuramate dehydrogenase
MASTGVQPLGEGQAAAMIIDQLPRVRGNFSTRVPLGATGWFRAGGAADIVFRPADHNDLATFLAACPPNIPVTIFGLLSNSIIRDGGIRGVVIRLGRDFARIEQQGDDIFAGAATIDVNVARQAAVWGRTGLEFLCGIPGSIGGAIRMNAGAIGGPVKDAFGQTSMKDVMVTATAIDRAGKIHTVTPDDMHMSYRHNEAPDDWIFTNCLLRTTPDEPATIAARINDLMTKRAEAQPVKARTGGSTFANPTVDELAQAGLPENTRTWQLIDKVGGRGLTIGSAQMSEHHCNFMINSGAATAYDLESLGEELRRRVHDQFGLTLRWEIKRIGEFASGQTPIPSL